MHTRISEIVRNSGLTKTDFAKRLGLSQPFVSRICTGDSTPSDRTIADICREFGCNEVWLRTGEGEPFKERTLEEEIMRFAVQTCKGSDDFVKAYVAMLSQLSPDGWKGLREQYELISENLKKSDRE